MDNIICVVGPTASGKTALAVALAKAYNGEVLSCDSMQIYKHMDIGTAKPTEEEMQGIPHHMIGVADPAEPFSAGKYVEMADSILRDILSRGKTCILCGGTGLYVDSLIAGREFSPMSSTGKREALEREADETGTAALLERLRMIDPTAAARLHEKDRKRIIRALEIFEETGMTITEHDALSQQVPAKYHPVWLGLTFSERAELYSRIDLRVDLMLQNGLLAEIEALLSRGIPKNATALQAIGYKEFIAAMQGEMSVEEAAALVKQRSRNYAKRQLTWFRRNPALHWIVRQAGMDSETIFDLACREIPFFARQ